MSYKRELSLTHGFRYADFGDVRLTARLQQIGQTVGVGPWQVNSQRLCGLGRHNSYVPGLR